MAKIDASALMAADNAANLIILEDNAEVIANAINSTIAKALDAVGIQATSDVAMITPVDTGRLRNSITHQLQEDGKACYVGTNVEYAPYVELGTHGRAAHPYLVPAMNAHASEYRDYLKKALENA